MTDMHTVVRMLPGFPAVHWRHESKVLIATACFAFWYHSLLVLRFSVDQVFRKSFQTCRNTPSPTSVPASATGKLITQHKGAHVTSVNLICPKTWGGWGSAQIRTLSNVWNVEFSACLPTGLPQGRAHSSWKTQHNFTELRRNEMNEHRLQEIHWKVQTQTCSSWSSCVKSQWEHGLPGAFQQTQQHCVNEADPVSSPTAPEFFVLHICDNNPHSVSDTELVCKFESLQEASRAPQLSGVWPFNG